jgi:hypothetical protein
VTKLDSPRRRVALLSALALSGVASTSFAQPRAAPSGASRSEVAEPPATPAPSLSPDDPGAAPGGPAKNAAQVTDLWQRGKHAWDQGRYADAIVDYEEVARLSQNPKAFYNLAQLYQKIDRKAEALAWFRRVRSSATREQLELMPNLDLRIGTLSNQVSVLKVNVNVPGARVIVRDTIVGIKPPDGPLEVSLNEGKAQVEIVSEGYQPYQKELILRGGSSIEIEVQLNQLTPASAAVAKEKPVYVSTTPFWSQWWFWAGAGVLIVGGATTVYALSTQKDPPKDAVPIAVSQANRFSGLGLRF